MIVNRLAINADQTIDNVTSSTDFVDVLTVDLTPSDNTDYLVLFSALNHSSTGKQAALSFGDPDTGNFFANSVFTSSIDSVNLNFGGFSVASFGVSPSPVTYRLQQNAITSDNSSTCSEGHISCIPLTSNDKFVLNNTDVTIDLDDTFANVTTIEFTPTTPGKYSILIHGEFAADTVDSLAIIRANWGLSGVYSNPTGEINLNLDQIDDRLGWNLIFEIPEQDPGSVIDIKIEAKGLVPSGASLPSNHIAIGNTTIIALRQDQFPNVYYSENRGQESYNTDTAFQDKDTLTSTVQDGQFIVIGNQYFGADNNANLVETQFSLDTDVPPTIFSVPNNDPSFRGQHSALISKTEELTDINFISKARTQNTTTTVIYSNGSFLALQTGGVYESSDTGNVNSNDTSDLSITTNIDNNDLGEINSNDTNTILVFVDSSDTGEINSVDSSSSNITTIVTDQGEIDSNDNRILLSLSNLNDSGEINSTDTSVISNVITSLDSGNINSNESITIESSSNLSYNSSINSNDNASSLLISTLSDQGTINSTDTVELVVIVNTSDNNGINSNDVITNLEPISNPVDTGAINSLESIDLLVSISSNDSGNINSSDVSLLNVDVVTNDNSGINSTDTNIISIYVDTTDNGNINSTENVFIDKNLNLNDIVAINSIGIAELFVIVNSSDLFEINSNDTSDILNTITTNDSGEINSTETSNIFTTLYLTDTGSIAGLTALTILSSLELSDLGNINSNESVNISSYINSNSIGAINSNDNASTFITLDRTDQGKINSNDTTINFIITTISDTGQINSQDVRDIFVPLTSSDQGDINSEDQANRTLPKTSNDYGLVIGGFIVNLSVNVAVNDNSEINSIESNQNFSVIQVTDLNTIEGVTTVDSSGYVPSLAARAYLTEFPAIIEVPDIDPQRYLIGTEINPGVIFKDARQHAITPSTVKFHYRTPDNVLHILKYGVDPEISFNYFTKEFKMSLVLDQLDEWSYRWEATGSYVAVGERTLTVLPSLVD